MSDDGSRISFFSRRRCLTVDLPGGYCGDTTLCVYIYIKKHIKDRENNTDALLLPYFFNIIFFLCILWRRSFALFVSVCRSWFYSPDSCIIQSCEGEGLSSTGGVSVRVRVYKASAGRSSCAIISAVTRPQSHENKLHLIQTWLPYWAHITLIISHRERRVFNNRLWVTTSHLTSRHVSKSCRDGVKTH